jgi:cytoskeletal protein RodZ
MNMPFYPPKIVRFAQDTHGFVPNFMTPASTEKVATKTTRQEDSPEKKKTRNTHTPKTKNKNKTKPGFSSVVFVVFVFFVVLFLLFLFLVVFLVFGFLVRCFCLL